MNNNDIEEIVLAKLSDVILTENEEQLFSQWYAVTENRHNYETLMREYAAITVAGVKAPDTQAAWTEIVRRSRWKALRRAGRYAAVAAVLLGIIFLMHHIVSTPENSITQTSSEHGKSVAVLTLSTGEEVALSDIEGTFDEAGTEVSAGTDNSLTYNPDNATDEALTAFNAIYVTKGGVFKVTLGDGTTVWLNADTKLHFPVTFVSDHRTVELTGEAYFDVAEQDDRPFIVKTGDYDIRVTGTEFNVKSYKAGATATTLVEGAVEIVHDGISSRLSPNQQALLNDGHVMVASVNASDYVAWQRHEFSFSLVRLEDILDELARWYDVRVEFDRKELSDMLFSAWFSRDSELSEIVEILNKTNKINLILKDRTIRVK